MTLILFNSTFTYNFDAYSARQSEVSNLNAPDLQFQLHLHHFQLSSFNVPRSTFDQRPSAFAIHSHLSTSGFRLSTFNFHHSIPHFRRSTSILTSNCQLSTPQRSKFAIPCTPTLIFISIRDTTEREVHPPTLAAWPICLPTCPSRVPDRRTYLPWPRDKFWHHVTDRSINLTRLPTPPAFQLPTSQLSTFNFPTFQLPTSTCQPSTSNSSSSYPYPHLHQYQIITEGEVWRGRGSATLQKP